MLELALYVNETFLIKGSYDMTNIFTISIQTSFQMIRGVQLLARMFALPL